MLQWYKRRKESVCPQEYHFPCKVFLQLHRVASIPADVNPVNSELLVWSVVKPANSSACLLLCVLRGRGGTCLLYCRSPAYFFPGSKSLHFPLIRGRELNVPCGVDSSDTEWLTCPVIQIYQDFCKRRYQKRQAHPRTGNSCGKS